MSERMNGTIDMNAAQVAIKIHETPAKLTTESVTMSFDSVRRQAELAVDSMVSVDYTKVRGTCGDERERIGLKSGDMKVEARPSAWGGPDIYALYVSEMAGMFSNEISADDRLEATINKNKAGEIPSGGHAHCAAAGSFGTVLTKIVENRESIHAFAQSNMQAYDAASMDEAIGGAARAVESGVYDGWNGEVALAAILGEEAGEAIEELADVPHAGRTVIRVKRPGYTVNQTDLHVRSGGEDSFDQDDPYADFIETVHAGGDTHKKRVMEHAREALLFGVAQAVPNTELHLIDLS